MVYRVIGMMSDSSLEALDMSFVELTETGGKWNYDTLATGSYPYSEQLKMQLNDASKDTVLAYHQLHTSFGNFLGEQVNRFIAEHSLEHRVHLVASNGHTVHLLPGTPAITAQLGHGAFIAAATKLPVVSDLLALDIAFGGQASPLAAIGEKLLREGEIPTAFSGTLITAFMGVLRWREEANMLSSVTGARQDSTGGALWLGTEA